MDYPSPETYFHPEMRGKCWITIIRNHRFHKSLHSIGMFSFILDGKGSDCNIEHILQYQTRIYTDFIRLFKNNTKNGLLSCNSCNTCVIRTGCSTYHCFSLINVLHCFFGAERSPGVQSYSYSGLNLNKPGPDQHLQIPIFSFGGSPSSNEIRSCQGYYSFALLLFFILILLSIFAIN